jgi:hypothetical protein
MKVRYWLGLLAVGIGIAILITFFSPLASSKPDGLERVAENEGFIQSAKDAPYTVIADYVFPWVHNEDVATVLAGIVGVLIVTAIALAAAFLLWRLRGAQRAASGESGPD